MALTITTRPSGFNAVHLPIMYKLTSNKWPVNSVDTTRTVNTFTNDVGYTKLTLSGDLKTGVQVLEFVKLTVNGVDGIYQIYNRYSDSQVTIDLEYDGGNTFGNCQYYYMNYYASIKVYAGLNSSHVYNSSKPIALISTIKGVPDSSGVITININEILKSDINIFGNDLSLSSLPNDIDSFTEFYIDHAEGYDYSLDGYTLSDYLSSYSSDSSNYAIAVNSKLPFKNGQGGVMTAYTQNGSMKFLTLFDTPVLVPDNYYDISFLRVKPYNFTQIRKRIYDGTTQLDIDYAPLDNYDEGVYRHQISQVSTEDTIYVQGGTGELILEPTDWTNGVGTFDVKNSTSFVKNNFVGTISAYQNLNLASGITPESITLDYTVTVGSAGSPVSITFQFKDGGGNTQSSSTKQYTSSGSGTSVFDFPALSGDVTRLYIVFNATYGPATDDIAVNLTASIGQVEGWTAATEEKQITVNEDCSNQSMYITWKNYLGGMDYWLFTAQKEYSIEIEDVTVSSENIFNDWPASYNTDRIDFETSRRSKESLIVRAENLSIDDLTGLKYLKTSSLVQVVTGTENNPVFRNILIDSDSFKLYQDGDKLYSFEFSFKYTDTIPNQSL